MSKEGVLKNTSSISLNILPQIKIPLNVGGLHGSQML